MAYEVIKRFISKNRSGKTLNPIGVVLHETATPNATAEAEYKYFNNGAGGRSASAHAFIDYTNIIQTIPWNEQAWHAGGTANKNYIGIELCHFDNEEKFSEIYKKAVWLFADLFINVIKITQITKDNLMSHAEVSAKWHETNHVDPISYFAKFGKTVDDFRGDVQSMIDSLTHVKPVEQPKPQGNESVKSLQHNLNRLFNAGLVEDGINGVNTTAAINQWSGIFGVNSVNGLLQATTETLAFPLCKLGSKSYAVRYIQYRLSIKPLDGDYGKGTLSSIKVWQKSRGLVADGVFGSKSWYELMR